jgi:recombinational DNA repair ATPase RecF
MLLESVSIRDFRNYKSLDINFNSRLTFLLEKMEKVKQIF